jgi:hypothetical protein
MAEEATNQAADPSAAPEEVKPSADSGSENKDTDDSGQVAAKAEGQTDGKTATEAAKTDAKPGTQAESQEYKPKSRRSAEYRIQQLARELAEAKKPKPAPPAANATQVDDEQPEPSKEPDDIEARIAAAVEKRLKPFETAHTKTADDAEISELFAGKSDERSKYESKIRNLWNLPAFKNLSADDLYAIVSRNDAVTTAKQQAIEEYKQAEKEAKEASTGGSSNSSTNRTGRKGLSVEDVNRMTPQQIEENNQRVLSSL